MPENTAPAAPVKKKRIDHLDTMRGMCLLFVNYFHSNISLAFFAVCLHHLRPPVHFYGGVLL